MTSKSYTSAIDRLLVVPEVFTGSELTVLFGWRSTMASNYLANWRRAGLIKSLGGRSDMHMNLVRNRHINPELALRRAFPRAVMVGIDVIRQAGWTTQIPTFSEVAIPITSTLYNVDGFNLSHRTQKWFDLVSHGNGIDDNPGGIDRLKPSWALADMISRASDRRVKAAWLLDPEDLDLDAILSDKQLPKALSSFGFNPNLLQGNGYEEIYSAFTETARERFERQR